MKELVYHRQLLPAVERNADRTAFFDGEYTATFGEHFDRVGRLSAALDGIGVARGDRFAVMALNSHQFLECYHAAFLGAGVINPLNLRLAPRSSSTSSATRARPSASRTRSSLRSSTRCGPRWA